MKFLVRQDLAMEQKLTKFSTEINDLVYLE